MAHPPLLGYGPPLRGSRKIHYAASLLEAYQESIRAERAGEKITEWTWGNEAGRKMLDLDPGEFYRKPPLERPKGLIACPRCAKKGCERCRWSGETTWRAFKKEAA